MTVGRGLKYVAREVSTRGDRTMQRPETTEPGTEAVLGEGRAANAEQPSKARRITFRIAATIVALWLLTIGAFGLIELVAMWLPGETILEIVDGDPPNALIHRTHFLAIGIVAWTVVPSILVQLRRPERRVAPMLLLAVWALGSLLVYGLSGTVNEWLIEEVVFVAIPVGLVMWLHPKRDEFFERPVFDRPMAYLAGAAAIPWLVYAVDNAGLQLNNVAGDPHAAMEHWATAALMGIIISAAAFLGSSDHTGWRLPAWIAGGASVIFGVHSLVFPGLASALPTSWAIAAIVWGFVFGGAVLRRSRVVKSRRAG